MREKYLKGFNEVERLYGELDFEGLLDFDNDKIEELVKLMKEAFSKPISDEKQEAIIGCFRDYLFIEKGKSFQETGADLCYLVYMVEIINSLAI